MLAADSFDLSPEATFRTLVDQVGTRVRGACGSSAELWLDGEAVVGISSHPDIARLLDTEGGEDASPARDAMRTLRCVAIEDTVTDTRWPAFAARALSRGVRSVLSAAHPTSGGVLTCTLYSLRPTGLTDGAPTELTQLLKEWSSSLDRATAYAGVRTEVHHLGEAIGAREIIEQAKGMLMQALRCDAETAYGELQESARLARVRTVDMAQRLVEHAEVRSRPAAGPLQAQRRGDNGRGDNGRGDNGRGDAGRQLPTRD